MVTRNMIVTAAQQYVGLPFDARLKSIGLLVAVSQSLGLSADMGGLINKFGFDMKPGDVVLLSIPSLKDLHGTQRAKMAHGILTERDGKLCVVRPDQNVGGIVEHLVDETWRRRIVYVFAHAEASE